MTEVQNPFQPPSANLLAPESAESAIPIVLVGSGRRFANHIIDLVACQIVEFIIVVPIVLIWGDQNPIASDRLWNFLFGILVTILYYVAMESLTGRTLGKMVTKTIVVNEFGQKPSLGQIFKRTFCRFIPFEGFSFLDEKSRGWHDSLSKTYVVKATRI
jgi:uncharacterized RDD family membrane protein YckC